MRHSLLTARCPLSQPVTDSREWQGTDINQILLHHQAHPIRSTALKFLCTQSSPLTLHFHRLCWTWRARQPTLAVKAKTKRHSVPLPCPWSLGLLPPLSTGTVFSSAFLLVPAGAGVLGVPHIPHQTNSSQALAFLTPLLHPQAIAGL